MVSNPIITVNYQHKRRLPRSATELLSAGIDLRTVAGRLGHGGGGATTLRVYAAWVAASDRKAAEILGSRMPKRIPRGEKDQT